MNNRDYPAHPTNPEQFCDATSNGLTKLEMMAMHICATTAATSIPGVSMDAIADCAVEQAALLLDSLARYGDDEIVPPPPEDLLV